MTEYEIEKNEVFLKWFEFVATSVPFSVNGYTQLKEIVAVFLLGSDGAINARVAIPDLDIRIANCVEVHEDKEIIHTPAMNIKKLCECWLDDDTRNTMFYFMAAWMELFMRELFARKVPADQHYFHFRKGVEQHGIEFLSLGQIDARNKADQAFFRSTLKLVLPELMDMSELDLDAAVAEIDANLAESDDTESAVHMFIENNSIIISAQETKAIVFHLGCICEYICDTENDKRSIEDFNARMVSFLKMIHANNHHSNTIH